MRAFWFAAKSGAYPSVVTSQVREMNERRCFLVSGDFSQGIVTAIGGIETAEGDLIDDAVVPGETRVKPWEVSHARAHIRTMGAMHDLLFSYGCQLVVSPRLIDLLRNVATPELQIIPTDLMSGSRNVAEYFAVFTPDKRDALDYDRADMQYAVARPDVAIDVRRRVFRHDKLPPFDFWQTEFDDWVANFTVAEAISRKGITGVLLTEALVS